MQFYLHFIDGTDTVRTELIYTVVNKSYINFSNNDVSITINSRGNFAFNDFPTNTQGIGLTYKDSENLLFEGATMLTTSFHSDSGEVCMIDVARSVNSTQNDGFTYKEIVNCSELNSDWKVVASTYKSSVTDTSLNFPYSFDVTCNTYASKSDQDRNYVVCEYLATNTSSRDIDSCYLGMYFDWDIGINGRNCIAEYDVDDGIAWNFSTEDDTLPFVGVKSLSEYPVNYYGIVNNNSDDSDIGVYNGFTDEEKYKAMTSGIANYMTSAADISQVISAGPFSLKSGETKKIPFAILVGKNYAELAETALRAGDFETLDVEEIVAGNSLTVFPNPSCEKEISVIFDCAASGTYSLKLFDISGNEVRTLFADKLIPAGMFSSRVDVSDISNGTYLLKVIGSEDSYFCKIIIKK